MKKRIRAIYPTRFWNEKKGRDNKDYYDTRGNPCSNGYKVRIPSLKRNKKSMGNFYKLFPYIKESLMNNQYVCRFGQPTLVGDIYVCKQDRIHNEHYGVGYRIRTTKFLKIW